MPVTRSQTENTPAKPSKYSSSSSSSPSKGNGKKLVLRKQTVSDIRMIFILTVSSISLLLLAVKFLGGARQSDFGVKLGWLAVIVWAIQWFAYFVAALFRTEKFYDFLGSGSFLLVALYTYMNSKKDRRQFLVLALVCIWGLRLMSFLVYRVHRAGRDRRFDQVKAEPFMFWFYWTVQGLWVYVTLLPVLTLNLRDHDRRQPPLGLLDYIGAAVWLVGFGIEVLSDHQKYTFRGDPANANEFVKHGLWSTCRHPNYFGETVLWFGMFLLCASPLNTAQLAISVVSPVFVCYVLLRLSGVPILEAYAEKQWGTRQDYKDYVRNSRVFLLLPWSP